MEQDEIKQQIDQLGQHAGRTDLTPEQRQQASDQLRQAISRSEELQRNQRDADARARIATEQRNRQQSERGQVENTIQGDSGGAGQAADARIQQQAKERAEARSNLIGAPLEGAGKPYFVKHRQWTRGAKVYGQHESYRQREAVEKLAKIEQQQQVAKEQQAAREAERRDAAAKRLVQERTAHEGRGGLELRNYEAEAEQVSDRDKLLKERSESTRIPHREAQQGEQLDGKLVKQEIIGTERVSIIEQQREDGTKERVIVPGRVNTMPGNEVVMTVDRNKKMYQQDEVQPDERSNNRGIER